MHQHHLRRPSLQAWTRAGSHSPRPRWWPAVSAARSCGGPGALWPDHLASPVLGSLRPSLAARQGSLQAVTVPVSCIPQSLCRKRCRRDTLYVKSMVRSQGRLDTHVLTAGSSWDIRQPLCMPKRIPQSRGVPETSGYNTYLKTHRQHLPFRR